MGVTARRAKKAQPVVYDDEEDEEDDEEDDFVPGQDDEEDGEEEEEEDERAGVLEGHLSYDEKENVLEYKGDAFCLRTNEDVVWNPLRDPPPSTSHTTSFQMRGTIPDSDGNSERLFNVAWTISADGAPWPGHQMSTCPGKTCEEVEEEEDGKQKASPKRPPLFYSCIGSEVASQDPNLLLKFQGGFYPPSSRTTNSVPLNCQFRYVIPETRHSVAAAAAPMVAVAAAVDNDDDDDDDDADADEDLDYDELIALHQDARVNVEELKRRYHHPQPNQPNQDGDDENDNGKPSFAKRIKRAPSKEEEEEDDDDDVGF